MALSCLADQPAAVAILKGKSVAVGLVRMVQTPSSCVVEATVDKLAIGEYCMNIHQLGDLSFGGNRYNRDHGRMFK